MTSKAEEITETVWGLLAHLGATHAEVADSLRKAGITGLRDNVHEDPIGNYLKANGVKEPEVDLEQAALDAYEEPDGSGDLVRVFHPPAVRDFLIAFDNGSYSELLASEVTA